MPEQKTVKAYPTKTFSASALLHGRGHGRPESRASVGLHFKGLRLKVWPPTSCNQGLRPLSGTRERPLPLPVHRGNDVQQLMQELVLDAFLTGWVYNLK